MLANTNAKVFFLTGLMIFSALSSFVSNDSGFTSEEYLELDSHYLTSGTSSGVNLDSVTPQYSEVGQSANVIINGSGFDQLWKYKRDIQFENSHNAVVENYTVMVQNPTLNQTDLVASYHFEEPSGTLFDTSGNENHATSTLPLSYGEDGKSGKSIRFNTTGESLTLPDFLEGDAITFSSWINVNSFTSSDDLHHLIDNSKIGDRNYFEVAYVSDGAGSMYASHQREIMVRLTTDGNQQGPFWSNFSLSANTWHYITVTYDGSDLKIYIDGSLKTGISLSGSLTDNPYLWRVGRAADGNTSWSSYSEGMDGWIDELKLYERSLTHAEIIDHHEADFRMDYGDVRFYDNGTLLDYQMVSDGFFRVEIPSMSAYESKTITMMYGALGLESQSQDLGGYHASEESMMFESDAVGYWPLNDKGDLDLGTTASQSLDTMMNGDNHNSIAVDSQDNIHISYYDATNSSLRYITYDGFSWSSPIVLDQNGVVGTYNSMAIDSNDNIHITYFRDDTSDDLMYVTHDGTSWSTPITLESTNNVGTHNSIAVDSNDHLHVSYYDYSNKDLRYIMYNGTNWSTPTALVTTGDVGEFSVIAIDSLDQIHISYQDRNADELEYIMFDGSSWSSPIVLDGVVGSYAIRYEISMAFDANDNLHISYYQNTQGQLKYITKNSTGSWSSPSILFASNLPGVRNDMAINSKGEIHVMYHKQTNPPTLAHIYHDGSAWTTAHYGVGGLFTGTMHSIAFDSEDNLHTSYYSPSPANNLKYNKASQIYIVDDVIDSSPYGHDATSNGVLVSTEAISDRGVEFDGANDYFEVSTYPNWYSGTEFTWALWVKMDDVSSNQLFIKHGTASGGGGNGAYLNYYQNKVMFTSPTGPGTGQGVMSPVNHIAQGEWAHIALTVNTSGSTHLYINGKDVTISAYNGPLTAISTPASSMTFGKDIVYNQQEFDGVMDEIFILNRELDASEVLNYYQLSLGSFGYVQAEQLVEYQVELDGFSPMLAATNVQLVNATTISCTIPSPSMPGSSDIDLLADGIWVARLVNAFHFVSTSNSGIPHTGTISDKSGNGNHGSIFGDPLYFDDTLKLDGVDDYISLGSGAWQTSTAAVEYSINLDTLPSAGFVGFRSWHSFGTFSAGLMSGIFANGTIFTTIGDSTNTGETNAPQIWHEVNATTNNWYTIGSSWNGTHLKLYVNGSKVGELQGNSYWNSNNMDWDSRDAYLGKTYHGSSVNKYTDGRYDNFRVWSTEIGVGSELVNWTMDVELGTWMHTVDFYTNGHHGSHKHSTTDADGNVYVQGDFKGTLNLGPHSVTANGSETDIYVAKLNKSGVWDWLYAGGGTGRDGGYGSIELDGQGHVYVIGYHIGGTSFSGTVLPDSAGTENLFLLKLNADDGSFVWAQTASGNIEGFDITFAPNHDPIISGMHQGTSSKTFGSHSIQGQGSWDGFVARIGANNATWMWATNAGSSAYDAISGGDVYGHTFVGAGKLAGSMTLGSQTLTPSGSADILIFGINVTTGFYEWADQIGGSGFEASVGREPIVIDDLGQAYIIGYSLTGSITVGSTTVTNAGDKDGLLIKYNVNTQTGLWIESFGGSGEDYFHDSSFDTQGNLLLTGIYQVNPVLGGKTLTLTSGCGIFAASRAPNGTYLWVSDAVGATAGCQATSIDAVNETVAVMGAKMPSSNTLVLDNLPPVTSAGSTHTILAWIQTAERPYQLRYDPIFDTDGDGYIDDLDAFPNDSTQWQDTDGDGYGDNLSGNNPDIFPLDFTQWNDTDMDGYGDNQSGNNPDIFPSDSTQWQDTDGDGYGDNWGNSSWNATRQNPANGSILGQWVENATQPDDCPWFAGSISVGRLGCPDDDGDGYANIDDDFPFDATQLSDADGDGYGDNLSGNNPDIFPSDSTQWNDTDMDGYGDNWADPSWNATRQNPANGSILGQWVENATQPDDCPWEWGNSTNGRLGCPDNDGDGLANLDDAFPDDPLRGGDADGDGYDDAIDDACPLIWGNSTQDRVGCLDIDGDGFSNPDLNWTVGDGADAFFEDSSQWKDTDGDGYGDNQTGFQPDACPLVWGNSSVDVFGCNDADGDGLSNTADPCPQSDLVNGTEDNDGDGCMNHEDAFPEDETEQTDSDGDGIGNNADPEPDVPLDTDNDGFPDRPGYNDSDDCPMIWGNSTVNLTGCVDTDGDGLADSEDDFPLDPLRAKDEDLDGFDDVLDDACPEINGNSTLDRQGCPDQDGDGFSDDGDAFPDDSDEWSDSDNDGVGNNTDAFPHDANETKDSDGDGVGDNADAFPNDGNETKDSDNDGIGDNEDLFPWLNNFNDTDNDGIEDISDDFPNDPTQWFDDDGDGYGDNELGNQPDLFTTLATQWDDTDGDGYGDNWGNATWNLTRLLRWPGVFIEGAERADHCPDEWGNSTVDGYYGCPDLDGDGIADLYDDNIEIEDQDSEEPNPLRDDSDGDGIPDAYDVCKDSPPNAYVDGEGCMIDQDRDGVDDLKDKCANTPKGVEVNVEGCQVITEETGFVENLMAGDTQTIAQTVGMGAILIAVIGFLQTNFIAAVLPDTFRWLQFLRKKSKLSAEEELELRHLQSVVQAYFDEPNALVEELQMLKSDITARYTNGEIKKNTREMLNTLVSDLIKMDASELRRVANDDVFFGLAGTTDTKEREVLLEQKLAMMSVESDVGQEIQSSNQESIILDKNTPSPEISGVINPKDNREYLEYPAQSGRWFLRNQRTGHWQEWKD